MKEFVDKKHKQVDKKRENKKKKKRRRRGGRGQDKMMSYFSVPVFLVYCCWVYRVDDEFWW